MAVHCDNCGTEVLPGHRFCRSCGRPTDDFAEEGTPTQMMPPESQVRGTRDTATTSPGRSETNPVYMPPQQNYYQQPYAPIQPTHPMPPYTPPRSRSPWGWIVAVIAVFMIGAFAIGAFVFSKRGSPGRGINVPEAPPPPPVPSAPGGTSFGRGTTVTRTYPLAPGARFDLSTIKGDVKIEGWDQPQAEVKVTKADSTEVRVSSSPNSLSLATEPSAGGIEVDYEIKLPRNVGRVILKLALADVVISDFSSEFVIDAGMGSVTLSDVNGRVQINAGKGDVNISDVRGQISVQAGMGEVEIRDVIGAVAVNNGNGDTSLSLASQSREPVTVNTGNGDIDIRFDSDVNADIEARTLNGDIDLDGGFGIAVREERVGKVAAGRVGSGGQRVAATTKSGDITITKQ